MNLGMFKCDDLKSAKVTKWTDLMNVEACEGTDGSSKCSTALRLD